MATVAAQDRRTSLPSYFVLHSRSTTYLHVSGYLNVDAGLDLLVANKLCVKRDSFVDCIRTKKWRITTFKTASLSFFTRLRKVWFVEDKLT